MGLVFLAGMPRYRVVQYNERLYQNWASAQEVGGERDGRGEGYRFTVHVKQIVNEQVTWQATNQEAYHQRDQLSIVE
jgi:hypothetical protein